MIKFIDRVFPFFAGVTALLCLGALYAIFFYAGVDAVQGISQKIFFVHVPSAMSCYADFIICSVASLVYLLKPRRAWDVAARTGADLGILFCIFVLISGPLWGYKAWGKPWVWDPQLTATFVLFLLYGGYVALRSLSPDTHTIRQIGAVLAVFACVDIPFIHYSIQNWGGQHPVVEREGGSGLSPDIAAAFGISMLAFLFLFTALYWLLLRTRLLELRVEELHLEVEDLAIAQDFV